MKILIVNGFANANHERYLHFKHLVMQALRSIEKLDVTGITIVEKHRSGLADYIFELHTDNADPAAITRFDGLDFVFLDGDCTIPPWHPGYKKVCTLVKMCMMTGKCLFGANFAASVLAYLCSTGGEMIHALNGNGRGAPLKNVQSIPAPVDDDFLPHAVILDSDTGDYYTYNAGRLEWEPKGNTGLVVHSSDRDRDFGARPNSARAGTRRRDGKLDSTCCRLADLKCCGRLEMQHHVYLNGLRHGQFIVNCASKWDLDERITSTSGNKYTVFVDSPRGPLLIEFGNALCAHFSIAHDYPETTVILQNFVESKFEQIKLHEHVDRSYMSSVSGMVATTGGSGPPKHIASLSANFEPSIPPPKLDGTVKGKNSPKKCRPLSAASTVLKPKIRPHSATPTMLSKHVHTKRVAASDDVDGSDNQREVHVTPSHDLVDCKNPATMPAAISTTKFDPTVAEDAFRPPKAKGTVKLCRVGDPHKPYCAYHRFQKMGQPGGGAYYSVVNDAPYVGPFEKRVVEGEKSKLRWMAGPFRTTFGKASTHVHPAEGILGGKYPYDVRNIPAHVLEPARNHDHPKPKPKIKPKRIIS
ncbi:hypothetical protein H310_07178 [Aphanomyces invadans]|uniref:Uncharacterized protein n=1 Tax=Aphanomyces invadans TaxID=157072 RepID=A0A024U2E5_9STRA|nr:hypothetical protein H310_07178 [Aphanomyces invadans]ETW00606.1 hypothetical protein H310_07178 [Aphanomyces invadans]|eukprot:XP_008870741.1 hypothetical protein H310_07178 [Aphanomyces invadans]